MTVELKKGPGVDLDALGEKIASQMARVPGNNGLKAVILGLFERLKLGGAFSPETYDEMKDRVADIMEGSFLDS